MIVVTLAVPLSMQRYNANAASNPAAIEQKSSASPKALSIDIQASRSQPTAGTGLGFEAEIQNISDAPVYLREQKVVLTIPPEVFGPFSQISNRWAFFPTEHTFPSGKDVRNHTMVRS